MVQSIERLIKQNNYNGLKYNDGKPLCFPKIHSTDLRSQHQAFSISSLCLAAGQVGCIRRSKVAQAYRNSIEISIVVAVETIQLVGAK